MRPRPSPFWMPAVAFWICFIFFSSTSLAAQWAERSYRFISELIAGEGAGFMQAGGWLHLLADKGFHMFMFFVLAVLLWYAWSARNSKGWMIVLTGAIVGSCSEYLQSFFPDRDPAVRDVCINTAGAVLGLAFMSWLWGRRPQTEEALPR